MGPLFENAINPEKVIAEKREELPPLKEGYVRLVHLTQSANADKIMQTGLDYQKHGMIQSVARAWEKENEVEFTSNDPRFHGENIVAVVMDMPHEEYRLHNDVAKSPGVVQPDCIVGIIKVLPSVKNLKKT